jgi:CHAT domain
MLPVGRAQRFSMFNVETPMPRIRSLFRFLRSIPHLRRVRILFIAATPPGTARVAWENDYSVITGELSRSKLGAAFSPVALVPVASPMDLERATYDYLPEVLHISAHGTPNGTLCFEENGQKVPMPLARFAQIVEHARDHLRVVLLMACDSDAHARAVIQWVPCAIGVPGEINNRDATVFTREFYLALAHDLSVADAYESAIGALRTAVKCPTSALPDCWPSLYPASNVVKSVYLLGDEPGLMRAAINNRRRAIASALVIAALFLATTALGLFWLKRLDTRRFGNAEPNGQEIQKAPTSGIDGKR